MNPQSSSLKDLIVALLLLVGKASAIRTVNPTIARDDNPTRWTLQQWHAWRDSKITDIFTPISIEGSSEHFLNRERVIDKCADANHCVLLCRSQV